MPVRFSPKKADEIAPSKYKKVYVFRYDGKRKLLVDPSEIDGTLFENIAILPRQDFKRWLIVTLDIELFMKNDLDPRLDVIPWITCPHIGTIIEVDEHGNVIRSKGDVVYCAC